MEGLEIALLIVLILIMTIFVWRWWKVSSENCKSQAVNQCSLQNKIMSRVESQGPHLRAPIHPGKGLSTGLRKSIRDGHEDYAPGSESYDAYSRAMEGFKGVRTVHPIWAEGRAEQDRLMALGLNSGVVESHKKYTSEMLHGTTGASMQPIMDHDPNPVTFHGLRRPQMHIAKPESGARVTSSEYHTQLHPGVQLNWSSAGNNWDIHDAPHNY